jgi:hypothetical protein
MSQERELVKTLALSTPRALKTCPGKSHSTTHFLQSELGFRDAIDEIP